MDSVPQDSNRPEEPKLLTITEIAEIYGVSRQTVHNLRRRGVFPAPVQEPGTTRLRWPQLVVDAYFKANPKQPGKRLEKRTGQPAEQERSVATYTLTMLIEADSDVTPEQIRAEIYDACSDVSFGFDITGVVGEE